jgi:hypothetical protein
LLNGYQRADQPNQKALRDVPRLDRAIPLEFVSRHFGRLFAEVLAPEVHATVVALSPA